MRAVPCVSRVMFVLCMGQDESNYPQSQRGAHREVAEGQPLEFLPISLSGIRKKEMVVDLALNRQVGTLRVDEFAELLRKTVREELQILMEEPSHIFAQGHNALANVSKGFVGIERMKILPLRPEWERYLKRHQLVMKWDNPKFVLRMTGNFQAYISSY